MKRYLLATGALAAGIVLHAADAAPASRVKFSGHLEIGATVNTGSPDDRQNFGRLFDDRSNEVLLNQLVFTAEQPLDSAAAGFDWGFKLQGLLGSDARFIHSVGLLDDTGSGIIQPDIVEAFLNLHLPTTRPPAAST